MDGPDADVRGDADQARAPHRAAGGLAEAYAAGGRPAPAYADPTVTAGATAIKAAHLMELREARAALEALQGSTHGFATACGDRNCPRHRLLLRPGAVLATHHLELRTRVAALRAREGLPPVRWTDPVLTVGVTPVKRVHLTELRNALDGAYDAAGRSRPTYTDHIVTAGVTAIKAVHVVELRNAIVALE